MPAQSPESVPKQIGPGKNEKEGGKDTDDVFARRLEMNGESGVILKHGDVL